MSLRDIMDMATSRQTITPTLSGFLQHHPGGLSMSVGTFQKIAQVMAEHEVDRDRSGHWHPSQLGQCHRRQSFEYYGAQGLQEVRPQLQMLFLDGHYRHLRWQVLLLDAGVLTDIEVPVWWEQYDMGGSMDGVREDEFVFELKGTRYLDRFATEPDEHHLLQVTSYMLASGLNQAVLVYEDKSSSKWVEHDVPLVPKIVDSVGWILEELQRHKLAGKLPDPLPECRAQEGAWKSCPYRNTCLGTSLEDLIDSESSS